jgi:outer membrane protein
MKKVLIAVNVILIVLVAVLFYLHFSTPRQQAPLKASAGAAAPAPLRIAYVNIDSLESHYAYFQEKSAELAKKQQTVQNDLAGRAKAIQDQLDELRKKAPTMTQSEGEAAQKSIIAKQQALQKREQDMRQQLMEEQQSFNADLHQRLDRFLEKYNADKRYTYILSYSDQGSDILFKDASCDITADVIRGLNAQPAGAK